MPNRATVQTLPGLILERVIWCALLGLVFGLYMSWAHLPAETDGPVRLWSFFWGLGLGLLLGALTGGIAGSAAGLLRRYLQGKRATGAAAAAEAFVYTLILLWLVMNEVVCALTNEVFGWDSFLYLFYNPRAVLEASWEMAGNYMIVVFAGCSALAGLLFVPLHRLHRNGGGGNGRLLKQKAFCGGVGTAIAIVVVTLAWQFAGRPSLALTTLSRSAPVLRAIKLPQALLGDELIRDLHEPTWGEPLISDKEYAARMGKPGRGRNVVLIILESVPAKALGCYGRQRDVSPHMDDLAAHGVLFEHCVAASSFSSYSLVSTIISQYMLRTPQNDHFRNMDFPFCGLPRMLKLAGYQTALFSSGNESFENIRRFYPPEDFDKYFSHDTSNLANWDCMRMEDHYTAEAFAEWLSKRQDARPLFCMFNLQSTHFSYEVPEPWASYYQPVPQGYNSGSAIIYMPPDLVPLMQNAYDNALRCMDHWIDQICQSLRSKGMWDNTVLAIVGDHGEAFMEHGLARHGVHLYEEMVHVPLIVTAPGVLSPRRVGSTVSQLDIAPTIAGLLGLRPHPSWQGRDVLAAEYNGAGRPIFTMLQLTRWQEAAYLDGVKYIYDLSECVDYLFDLRTDPLERNNLAKANPELRQYMQDLLGQWHTRQLTYHGRNNRPLTRYIGHGDRLASQAEPATKPAAALSLSRFAGAR